MGWSEAREESAMPQPIPSATPIHAPSSPREPDHRAAAAAIDYDHHRAVAVRLRGEAVAALGRRLLALVALPQPPRRVRRRPIHRPGDLLMPLVRFEVPAALAAARVAGLRDAVHAALVAHAGVPADDRFHVVARHEPEALDIDQGFLGVARGPEAVIVAITFRRGRSDDQKRALYRAIASGAETRAGLRPADVMVVVTENGLADWSFGDGIAHYAQV